MYSTRVTTRLKIVQKKKKKQQRKVYIMIYIIYLITRLEKLPCAIGRIVMTSFTLMLL